MTAASKKNPRPRTGEPREVRQPLKIDRLPPEVRDQIQQLRAQGKTWQEIEELSKQFVPWETLPTAVLELFPDLRLPHSNLQRWYDLRVEQVGAELAAEAERARQFSAAIAKVGDVEQLGDAAVNALSDIVFSVMRARTRNEYAEALESLGYLAAKVTDAKSKKLRAGAESRRIALLEEKLQIVKAESAKLQLELQGATKTGEAVDPAKLLESVKQIYGAV